MPCARGLPVHRNKKENCDVRGCGSARHGLLLTKHAPKHDGAKPSWSLKCSNKSCQYIMFLVRARF